MLSSSSHLILMPSSMLNLIPHPLEISWIAIWVWGSMLILYLDHEKLGLGLLTEEAGLDIPARFWLILLDSEQITIHSGFQFHYKCKNAKWQAGHYLAVWGCCGTAWDGLGWDVCLLIDDRCARRWSSFVYRLRRTCVSACDPLGSLYSRLLDSPETPRFRSSCIHRSGPMHLNLSGRQPNRSTTNQPQSPVRSAIMPVSQCAYTEEMLLKKFKRSKKRSYNLFHIHSI